MKFLRDLFYYTLLGKTYKTIECLVNYIKDYDYIADTLYSEAFKIVLKEYLNVDIRKDWIGRLYGVVNPNINSKGEFDISRTIIELDDENTNNNEYIKHWTYKQLIIIGEVFKIDNLWHFLDLKFEHVGPKEADNYLLVFDIVSRKELVRQLKKTLKHLLLYTIIGVAVYLKYIYL